MYTNQAQSLVACLSTQPSDMTILIRGNFHIAKLEHACELLLRAMTSGHVMIFKHKSQEVS